MVDRQMQNSIGSEWPDDYGDNNSGSDTVTGTDSSNTIDGGNGSDTLKGGGGEDTIIGGYGSDILYGGGGGDIFVYNAKYDSKPGNPDLIMDYEPGFIDGLDLSPIDADETTGGINEAFVAELPFLPFSGSPGSLITTGSTVEGDVNGDMIADFKINFDVFVPGPGEPQLDLLPIDTSTFDL